MADFRTVVASGTTLEPWEDPSSGSKAGRLNAQPEHEHRRLVGTVGVQVEFQARVGGALAPLDGALGGRLFSATFAESPILPPPAISSPAGQSSIQRFTPSVTGHYTLQISRAGGGAIIHHVDVDP